MIRTVRITNYKSISELTVELGRVTVLIGANGCGKTNLLEAIAFVAAASQDKLDHEFLASRGIRVTDTQFMKSAFSNEDNAQADDIEISLFGDNGVRSDWHFSPDNKATFPKWLGFETPNDEDKREIKSWLSKLFSAVREKAGTPEAQVTGEMVLREAEGVFRARAARLRGSIPQFLVFAPENTSLRAFQSEGQILPLGIRGEGLFSHLRALAGKKYRQQFEQIKQHLSLVDWFADFEIPENLSVDERKINIRDRFLPGDALFDQRSANEGFLFLLFYVTLMVSPETPAFFAIDNIDTSLNPKLCIALIQQLVVLAKEHGKQVIITTHNPAVLDGLDLRDDEQQLLVVDRNKAGHTRVHRVDAPKPIGTQTPVSLSEAFMRGYLGGLPNNS